MSEPIDIIGRWAVNGGGRIGRIERLDHKTGARCWFGTGLDGQEWSSYCPHLLAPFEQVALNER